MGYRPFLTFPAPAQDKFLLLLVLIVILLLVIFLLLLIFVVVLLLVLVLLLLVLLFFFCGLRPFFIFVYTVFPVGVLAFDCVVIVCSLESIRPSPVQGCKAANGVG